ncbi:hypothetical protein K432DRAFT_404679 [Lepidopterella palustris CBS 459.81]|uniref:Helicase C-terminal domain-containing protein n=1 Tax=Lepidopterella palustris CBS 459.81 TaxID=1314670 RepID=A0A8E2EAQ8_9PEZI|nr:hypothetical protein K432DRAFT_404679 [Lepidopterella palustris CBS 459.81]
MSCLSSSSKAHTPAWPRAQLIDNPSPEQPTITAASSSSIFEIGPPTPAVSSCSPYQAKEVSALRNLTDYIPLGCLRYEQPFRLHTSLFNQNSRWIELLLPSLTGDLAKLLGDHVIKLLRAGWIRIFLHWPEPSRTLSCAIVRIYLLPHDVGRGSTTRQSKELDKRCKRSLQKLLSEIDISPEAWSGHYVSGKARNFDPWATAENYSLFYLFNRLPSPAPSPEKIPSRYTRLAVEELLDSVSPTANDSEIPYSICSLKSKLYPYQARSAAFMIQRESAPQRQLDPRLEVRLSPDGREFYYGARDCEFIREPRYYESNRGGILAETMGLGKTIICLAVILATKYHLPQIPPEYQEMRPVWKQLRQTDEQGTCLPNFEMDNPTLDTGHSRMVTPTLNRLDPDGFSSNNANPQVYNFRQLGTLAKMTAAVINRNGIPWKAHFKRIESETGDTHYGCMRHLEAAMQHYEIPVEKARTNRSPTPPQPRTLMMCSGTIIVVPRNLLHQWQSEIKKHVVEGSLSVLVMDSKMPRVVKSKKAALGIMRSSDENSAAVESQSDIEINHTQSKTFVFKKILPPAQELAKYDIVLFSRSRFEQEIRDGKDSNNRQMTSGMPNICRCPYIGSSRERDCRCLKNKDLYHSPLKDLHWLRIIVDEGHGFSSKDANAVEVATQLQAERRWAVTGTPAHDLVGVEMDLSSKDTSGEPDHFLMREAIIHQRKDFDPDAKKAVMNLGNLASGFLQIRPWSHLSGKETLRWDNYIYRHEDPVSQTYSGFSTCFMRILEQMVVKTRPEDYEIDVVLPPLNHRIVYLKPSWYDKMSANLFVQVLRANAITSERTDADYLFHNNKKSQKARGDLIRNLRQSNFTWTGFSQADVLSTIKTSLEYLTKDEKRCSETDFNMLSESTRLAAQTLESPGWLALSRTHEVGLFVEDWPQDSAETFALGSHEHPLMIGVTQLTQAQGHVNSQIGTTNPTDGLKLVGELAKAQSYALETAEVEKKDNLSGSADMALAKTGVPLSCVAGEPAADRRVSAARFKSFPVKSTNRDTMKGASNTVANAETGTETMSTNTRKANSIVLSTRPQKRRLTLDDQKKDLPEESPLLRTRVIGTCSSKLSYIIEKVMKHQKEEKILIFYDGDNPAYYIAQCLEFLHIDHRIYAGSLDNMKRSEYVVAFNENPEIRVLLIDVACGALGLNLNAASVVLIVNPINRPSIEAQAIKRAHRIGQTREVLVETLILEGTIEEAIFERAKDMSKDEHDKAKVLEDDDKIKSIIQNAKVIHVDPNEMHGYAQMAMLQTPQQVFGRPGRPRVKVEEPRKRQQTAKSTADATSRLSSKLGVQMRTQIPRPQVDATGNSGETADVSMETDTAQQTSMTSLFGGPSSSNA